MSKKQWMALLMLFLAYLLLGASIFYYIEHAIEIEQVQKAHDERIEINALLYKHCSMETNGYEIFKKLTDYCGKSVYNYTENETDRLKWDFYNSFYFAYTVVSTIGYGNLTPTSTSSRILMIFYALLGIPMNGILLSQLGDFFSVIFIRAHHKYKSYKENHREEYTKKLAPLETRKAGLAARVLMYLAPGFVMFIFFPASVISYYEETTYDEAVYYAFVTLTTIGFGDIVAGQDNTKSRCYGPLFILYKAFLIVWIVFGLGYMVMIITFITRGMRSKKIVRLEHKLAMNIKQTQSKIWGEFNKEISYFRRVFNELQLSKVKRIYVDENEYELPLSRPLRSNSFPDLRELVYGGLTPLVPPRPRRRANSEVIPAENPVRARVVSETDLQRIDKKATFATHAIVQPAELLARLVNILGYIPPSPDDDESISDLDTSTGVQGFSDKEILSNEHSFNWKLGSDRLPFEKPRSRAVSEVHLDPKFVPSMVRNHEWTWSGPAASRKIQEIIKARQNVNKESKSIFPALNLPKSVPLPKWIKHLSNNKKEGRTRNSVSVGDLERGDENYLSTINNNNNEASTYFTHTGANLPSSLENSNLLEETSLADFLRALTALHTRVGAVPDEYVKKPQRKMGTASLTPPKLPSLMALFSPPTDFSTSDNLERRFSLRTTENSGSSTPNDRRGSVILSSKPRHRRFSLRPVINPLGGTLQATPHILSFPRYNMSNIASGHKTDLVYESSKKPLVHEESAPGISSPIATSSERRFSLRSEQSDTLPKASIAPPITSALKSIPRWRAGMLQRQINQINLQKRVRALSLSDVNVEHLKSSERNLGISPLALNADVRTFERSKDSSKNMKTVTIVSPSLDDRGKHQVLDRQKFDSKFTDNLRIPFHRTMSASSNSFNAQEPKILTTNPFIDIESQKSNVSDCDESYNNGHKRTTFESPKEGEKIMDVLTMTEKSQSSLQDMNISNTVSRKNTSESLIGLDKRELAEKKRLGDCENMSRESEIGGLKDKSRKVSVVSIGHWADSKRVTDRKESTGIKSSQTIQPFASSSRNSSSLKLFDDNATVSIKSYKPHKEIKIDKPPENIYKISNKAENDDLLKKFDIKNSIYSSRSVEITKPRKMKSSLKLSVDAKKDSDESTT